MKRSRRLLPGSLVMKVRSDDIGWTIGAWAAVFPGAEMRCQRPRRFGASRPLVGQLGGARGCGPVRFLLSRVQYCALAQIVTCRGKRQGERGDRGTRGD